MPRFAIIGIHDCPWYAKAEKLAEEIVALNPAIEFHKEMKDRFHWNVGTLIISFFQTQTIQQTSFIQIMS
jgi:hypothetical protein